MLFSLTWGSILAFKNYGDVQNATLKFKEQFAYNVTVDRKQLSQQPLCFIAQGMDDHQEIRLSARITVGSYYFQCSAEQELVCTIPNEYILNDSTEIQVKVKCLLEKCYVEMGLGQLPPNKLEQNSPLVHYFLDTDMRAYQLLVDQELAAKDHVSLLFKYQSKINHEEREFLAIAKFGDLPSTSSFTYEAHSLGPHSSLLYIQGHDLQMHKNQTLQILVVATNLVLQMHVYAPEESRDGKVLNLNTSKTRRIPLILRKDQSRVYRVEKADLSAIFSMQFYTGLYKVSYRYGEQGNSTTLVGESDSEPGDLQFFISKKHLREKDLYLTISTSSENAYAYVLLNAVNDGEVTLLDNYMLFVEEQSQVSRFFFNLDSRKYSTEQPLSLEIVGKVGSVILQQSNEKLVKQSESQGVSIYKMPLCQSICQYRFKVEQVGSYSIRVIHPMHFEKIPKEGIKGYLQQHQFRYFQYSQPGLKVCTFYITAYSGMMLAAGSSDFNKIHSAETTQQGHEVEVRSDQGKFYLKLWAVQATNFFIRPHDQSQQFIKPLQNHVEHLKFNSNQSLTFKVDNKQTSFLYIASTNSELLIIVTPPGSKEQNLNTTHNHDTIQLTEVGTYTIFVKIRVGIKAPPVVQVLINHYMVNSNCTPGSLGRSPFFQMEKGSGKCFQFSLNPKFGYQFAIAVQSNVKSLPVFMLSRNQIPLMKESSYSYDLSQEQLKKACADTVQACEVQVVILSGQYSGRAKLWIQKLDTEMKLPTQTIMHAKISSNRKYKVMAQRAVTYFLQVKALVKNATFQFMGQSRLVAQGHSYLFKSNKTQELNIKCLDCEVLLQASSLFRKLPVSKELIQNDQVYYFSYFKSKNSTEVERLQLAVDQQTKQVQCHLIYPNMTSISFDADLKPELECSGQYALVCTSSQPTLLDIFVSGSHLQQTYLWAQEQQQYQRLLKPNQSIYLLYRIASSQPLAMYSFHSESVVSKAYLVPKQSAEEAIKLVASQKPIEFKDGKALISKPEIDQIAIVVVTNQDSKKQTATVAFQYQKKQLNIQNRVLLRKIQKGQVHTYRHSFKEGRLIFDVLRGEISVTVVSGETKDSFKVAEGIYYHQLPNLTRMDKNFVEVSSVTESAEYKVVKYMSKKLLLEKGVSRVVDLGKQGISCFQYENQALGKSTVLFSGSKPLRFQYIMYMQEGGKSLVEFQSKIQEMGLMIVKTKALKGEVTVCLQRRLPDQVSQKVTVFVSDDATPLPQDQFLLWPLQPQSQTFAALAPREQGLNKLVEGRFCDQNVQIEGAKASQEGFHLYLSGDRKDKLIKMTTKESSLLFLRQAQLPSSLGNPYQNLAVQDAELSAASQDGLLKVGLKGVKLSKPCPQKVYFQTVVTSAQWEIKSARNCHIGTKFHSRIVELSKEGEATVKLDLPQRLRQSNTLFVSGNVIAYYNGKPFYFPLALVSVGTGSISGSQAVLALQYLAGAVLIGAVLLVASRQVARWRKSRGKRTQMSEDSIQLQ